MYCVNCGRPIPEGHKLCPDCQAVFVRRKTKDTARVRYPINAHGAEQMYGLAKGVYWILVVISVVLAIGVLLILAGTHMTGLGVVAMLPILAVGLFLATLTRGLIRSLGEIVQNTAETAGAVRFLCRVQGGVPEDSVPEDSMPKEAILPEDRTAVPISGTPVPPGRKGEFFACPCCRSKQVYGVEACDKCGVPFLYGEELGARTEEPIPGVPVRPGRRGELFSCPCCGSKQVYGVDACGKCGAPFLYEKG